MSVLAVLFIVFALLLINEAWARQANVHSELSRKFIHLTVGSFVAFWPWLLNWRQIEVLSLAFLIAVIISKYANIFQAIHSVQRPTLGEVFFAIAVGGVAMVTHDRWIYAAALLQMSLADGLAAVIGFTYGRRTDYHIFGQLKSLVGSLTFLIVSCAILILYSHYGHQLAVLPLLGMAAGATVIENIGVFGTDNLLVPLFAAWLLTVLH